MDPNSSTHISAAPPISGSDLAASAVPPHDLSREELTKNLIKEFRESGNQNLAIRDRLFEEHAALIGAVANTLSRDLLKRCGLTRDDIASHGALGLIEAIEKFDPDRGNAFSGFAWWKIFASMLDSVRTNRYLPRNVARKVAHMNESHRNLRARLQKEPSHEELAEELGTSEQAVTEMKQWAKVLTQGNIRIAGDRWQCDTQDMVRIHLEDDKTPRPEQRMQQEDLLQIILAPLSKSARTVVVRYFFDENTMPEIAAELGVTKGRISQLLHEAYDEIKEHIQANSGRANGVGIVADELGEALWSDAKARRVPNRKSKN